MYELQTTISRRLTTVVKKMNEALKYTELVFLPAQQLEWRRKTYCKCQRITSVRLTTCRRRRFPPTDRRGRYRRGN